VRKATIETSKYCVQLNCVVLIFIQYNFWRQQHAERVFDSTYVNFIGNRRCILFVRNISERPIPTNATEYEIFEGPLLRITQDMGACHVPGKIYGETRMQYKIVALANDKVVRRRYAKSPKAHFEPCKYCLSDVDE